MLLFFPVVSYGQDISMDSIRKNSPQLNFEGFVDGFYSYDFNQPKEEEKQPYFYNYNRHNQVGLNQGLVRLSILHPKYRAHIAIQSGTYPTDNYASEPGLIKHIFEANVGISVNQLNNLWMDAGIFASHIGFESVNSFDNWTLTRSLLSDNSPYYLSGVKLTYKPGNKWTLLGLVCNGWQHIKNPNGKFSASLGTQITFSPTPHTLINWSTFLGTDDPDTLKRKRYFNNFYAEFQLTNRLGLILGFDVGMQQRSKGTSSYVVWYSPVAIAHYRLEEKWVLGIRAEYYQDKNGVIIHTDTPNGFATSGISLNVDYQPFSNMLCRIEGRWLTSREAVFNNKNGKSRSDTFITNSISFRWN